jgi:hypothetical protein
MIGNLTLCLNGNELNIPIELSNDQIQAICESLVTEDPKTGWELPADGDTFYYCDALDRVQAGVFDYESTMLVEMLSEKSNIFSSEFVASNIARANTLLRHLRKRAAAGRDAEADPHEGYTILYNYETSCLEIGMTGGCMALGDIIFDTEERCRDAINEYASELIWYFTEKKNRL